MRKNKLESFEYRSLSNYESLREVSFDDAFEAFCMDRRRSGTRESTITYYQKEMSIFRRYIVREFSRSINVSEIDLTTLENFVLYLREERQNSIGGTNAKIRAVRAFLYFCEDMKYLRYNPAEKWKQLKGKEPEINTFTTSQISSLLKETDRTTFTGLRDYVLILFLLDTGSRISEALSVEVDDVSLVERRVFLRNTKSNLSRYVPISERLCNEIKQYIRIHDQMSKYLFCSLKGELLDRNRFRYVLHTLGKQAGIKGVRCSPHTFRHTFAKFYIVNGGDVFSLMQILGHSTLDMTKKYVRLFSTDINSKHKKYSPLNNF
ncbi:tyrosine-type recombinase/integrase [Shouchella miscanthi]|uniref:Tyrosine-type recombinase/integrase n=1 Tax=Shouchella miscanthi TaxID=2598861 RepID=A0ABU6NGZ2_9BACI|nr:tyrosine-type recombinase/integrase [Shouchella miscanthi]MED4127491.1 tyrosine-type recombinase/integrase [Shouchella miscanthi]